MTIYIWDSPATDITGRNLATALNAQESREKPAHLTSEDVVICWGTKIDRDVTFPAPVKVLNHSNAIRKNRNKAAALTEMKGNRELSGNIQPFCASNRIGRELDTGNMTLPVIGRKNYHQGGSGFWLCITRAQVDIAIGEGAQYFQGYIDIQDEYRLHVFDGKVIYAVKKTENATKEGWVAQRVEKVTDYAAKNNININAETMNYVLGIIYAEQQLPDRVVRSNHRGWKFSNIRLASLSNDLKAAAIKAVSVLGLDFGAVDCCVDTAGNVFIIEVNTAPGLQGTTLEKYTEAFQAKINEIQRAARPAVRPVRQAAAPARANRAADDQIVAAVNNAERPANIDQAQFRMMINAVRSPAEARRLLDLMGA